MSLENVQAVINGSNIRIYSKAAAALTQMSALLSAPELAELDTKRRCYVTFLVAANQTLTFAHTALGNTVALVNPTGQPTKEFTLPVLDPLRNVWVQSSSGNVQFILILD